MKSYEEIAEGVLSKRDKYLTKRRAKQKMIIRTVSVTSLFAAAAFTAVGIYGSGLLSDDFHIVPEASSEHAGSTTETAETQTDEYVSLSKDSEYDSFDSDTVHITPLSDPLNDPSVIWGMNESKGEISSDITAPMGSIYFSDSLEKLIENNDSSAVFAVRVDFSPCITTAETESFVYNGNTIITLRERLDISDKESVTEYKRKMNEIRKEFYYVKTLSFSDTFRNAGITIYTPDTETYISSNCFLVFATSEQLNEITCSTEEAFILFPASKLK